MKKVTNYIKSLPTRRAAKKEYNSNVYTWTRAGGGEPTRMKRANPLRTYNKASTGMRKKAR